MKKNFIMTVVVAVSALLLSACSDETQQASSSTKGVQTETAIEHAEKHLDPKYVCPMHPQIVRDEPGSCPICGMDLVQKETEQQAASSGEKKILYWVAPMDPSYRRDKPGKSPMGMDLVPVYDEGSGVSVRISPTVENNMGVRTATVKRDRLWRRIDTVGYVDFDENKITHVHIRTKGWIEKLKVKSEGERVKKGDLLFELYSPELVNAQEEYLQALSSGNRHLITASRERLLALDVSEQQIATLSKTRVVSQYVQVYAPQDGIVAQLKAREGMYVAPRQEIMSLADLSSIWLLAEVFESQANWVRVGEPAEVRLSYLPGKVWEGEVEFIYPSLDSKTRTLKARLRFDNPGEQLKPNMFADVVIYGGAKSNILVIPREALIRTGEENRVILALGKGRFQPRKVNVGIESGDWVEIIDGIREGDSVVTSGQFLIDSEASLKASIARMTSPDEKPTMDMQSLEKPMEKKIVGHGVLHKIMPDENKVNMSHEPIPALGWPDMTMNFAVKPGVSLEGYNPDDKVEFELEKGDDGYVIKSMHSIQ
jgi:Cu(I)/Ag(I) efflux system membrane fusion protein